MKIRALFLVIALAALAMSAAAQTTTTQLIDATAITQSPSGTTDANPFIFGTRTLNLTCTQGATATLSGPEGGNLIADNDILLNGTTVCPFPDGCFNGTFNDPLLNLGEPAENSYTGIAPISLTGLLLEGTNTFTLRDRGYTYGSSALELTTTGCTVGYPVCHRQGRDRFRTLFVDSQNAVNAHVRNHEGDHAGPCTGSET